MGTGSEEAVESTGSELSAYEAPKKLLQRMLNSERRRGTRMLRHMWMALLLIVVACGGLIYSLRVTGDVIWPELAAPLALVVPPVVAIAWRFLHNSGRSIERVRRLEDIQLDLEMMLCADHSPHFVWARLEKAILSLEDKHESFEPEQGVLPFVNSLSDKALKLVRSGKAASG